MQTYISLLRGINVSGQKMIKMTELKTAYEELKFKNVRTYIQSGNVIFEASEESLEKLSAKIVKKIKEKFGFDVPVIVIAREELEAFISANPFLKKVEDISRLYITILAAIPAEAALKTLSGFSFIPDEFVVLGRGIYLNVQNGYGNSKLNNNFFENKLKVSATTRNWKTMLELKRMANEG